MWPPVGMATAITVIFQGSLVTVVFIVHFDPPPSRVLPVVEDFLC